MFFYDLNKDSDLEDTLLGKMTKHFYFVCLQVLSGPQKANIFNLARDAHRTCGDLLLNAPLNN